MSTPVQEPSFTQPKAEPQPVMVPHLAGHDIANEREDFFIRTPRFARLLEFLADLLIISVNAVATFVWFSLAPLRLGGHLLPRAQTGAALLLFSALLVLACRGLHLYVRPRRVSRFGNVRTLTRAAVLATALMCAYLYLAGSPLPIWFVLCAGILDLGTLIGYRALRMTMRERMVATGRGTRNVLIIGAGRVGQALAAHLDQNKPLGYVVKGFLDQNHHQDARLLGNLEDFSRIVRTHFVDEVLITIPSERQVVREVVDEAQAHGVAVKVVPELFDGLGLQAPIDYIGRFPTMELHREPIPKMGLWAKRALDLCVSGAALVVSGPLMLLVAIAIKLDSPGPVLYRCDRVGKKGRRFVCYKFRSMVANADALKEDLRHRNYRNGPTFKVVNDPRITALGRWLRKYSIDELPQLWNIFRGEMSLVGPRPPSPDEVEQYYPEQMSRLAVKPGLTGLWQVVARRDPSFETNMALDLEYIENWTLALDFKILLLTMPAVMKGDGQ